MILICLVFLLSFIVNGKADTNNVDIEGAYLTDVSDARQNCQNHFLQFKPEIMASFCQELFSLNEYRYFWKIHLNIIAYKYLENISSHTDRITFHLPIYSNYNTVEYKRLQVMVPCYGQHRPIRTNWKTDDYFEFFFVATIRNLDVFYVFRREIKNNQTVFVIHQRIKLEANQQFFFPLEIPQKLKNINFILNTVQTINYNLEEVEGIFVREMIEDRTRFLDQIQNLNPRTLVTVCLSIFKEKIFLNEGFQIDEDFLLLNDHGLQKKSVVLYEDHSIYRRHRQIMYQCKEKRGVIQKYYISSGRRLNSIFVYRFRDQMDNSIFPAYLIENFNFNRLSESNSSENEIYNHII